MKIKILTSLAGTRFAFAPGDVAEFPEAEAKRFIASGVAEAISAPKKRSKKPAEQATAPSDNVETATID